MQLHRGCWKISVLREAYQVVWVFAPSGGVLGQGFPQSYRRGHHRQVCPSEMSEASFLLFHWVIGDRFDCRHLVNVDDIFWIQVGNEKTAIVDIKETTTVTERSSEPLLSGRLCHFRWSWARTKERECIVHVSEKKKDVHTHWANYTLNDRFVTLAPLVVCTLKITRFVQATNTREVSVRSRSFKQWTRSRGGWGWVGEEWITTWPVTWTSVCRSFKSTRASCSSCYYRPRFPTKPY